MVVMRGGEGRPFFSVRGAMSKLKHSSLLIAICLMPAVCRAQVASHPHVVARVNGEAVLSDRLAIALNALIPLSSYHQNVDAAKMSELRRQALDNVIAEELQYQEAARLKLTVSKRELAEGIDRLVARYGSRKAFDEALKRSGSRMDEIERNITRVLMVKKAYDKAVGSHCAYGETETASFYEANRARFVMPEQLHFWLITVGVDPSSGAAGWQKARARAEEALGAIRAGRPFEEIARSYSTDPSREKGGDMGYVHRGSLSPEIESTLTTLKAGEIGGLIQTIYGFHLVRFTDVRPPLQKELAEVREELVKDLSEKRCDEMYRGWVERLRGAAKIVIYAEQTR